MEKAQKVQDPVPKFKAYEIKRKGNCNNMQAADVKAEVDRLAEMIRQMDAIGSVYSEVNNTISLLIKGFLVLDPSASLDSAKLNGEPLTKTYYCFQIKDTAAPD